LGRAIATICEAGRNLDDIELRRDRCLNVSPELAAELVLIIENQWTRWISPDSAARMWTAGRQTTRGLLDKLRSLAKPHLVILRSVDVDGEIQNYGITAILHSTAALQTRIAELTRLASERALTFIAAPLSPAEIACQVRYVHYPQADGRVHATLCVAPDTLWVSGRYQGFWHEEHFQTERLRIAELFDIELMPRKTLELSANITARGLRPFQKRLQALVEGESLYDELAAGVYDAGRALDSHSMVVADLIAFGRTGERPFSTARCAWAALEAELEQWEQALDNARRDLVAEVLGIQEGDTVIVRDRDRASRIQVEYAQCSTYDGTVTFVLTGRLYKKDGQLGKRTETFYLQTQSEPSDTQVRPAREL